MIPRTPDHSRTRRLRGLSRMTCAHLKLIGARSRALELGLFARCGTSNAVCVKTNPRGWMLAADESAWVLQGLVKTRRHGNIGDGLEWSSRWRGHPPNPPELHEPFRAGDGVGGNPARSVHDGRRPIGFEANFVGAPEHPKQVIGVGRVEGIGGYGNSLAFDRGGKMRFHTRYDGKLLSTRWRVVSPEKTDFLRSRIRREHGRLFISARNRRDGIHGATMASAAFETRRESAPTVSGRRSIRKKTTSARSVHRNHGGGFA